jgi:hypothetical protein
VRTHPVPAVPCRASAPICASARRCGG